MSVWSKDTQENLLPNPFRGKAFGTPARGPWGLRLPVSP